VATVESTAIQIGHINLNMKRTGKPGAGKPHAGFDEAGAGNGLLSTAPVLDPTLDETNPFVCFCEEIFWVSWLKFARKVGLTT